MDSLVPETFQSVLIHVTHTLHCFGCWLADSTAEVRAGHSQGTVLSQRLSLSSGHSHHHHHTNVWMCIWANPISSHGNRPWQASVPPDHRVFFYKEKQVCFSFPFHLSTLCSCNLLWAVFKWSLYTMYPRLLFSFIKSSSYRTILPRHHGVYLKLSI